MNGVLFGNIHSFRDLYLVLSKVEIPPAKPKTIYVDLPGADGSVDLTEAFGKVNFSNRECTFLFTVLPNHDFEQVKRIVSSTLNGLKTRIVVEKDPEYYWNGRCYVDEYKSDEGLNQIVVAAIVDPYKLKKAIISEYGSGEEVQETISIAGLCPVTLEWKFTEETTVIVGTETKNFSSGTYRMYDVEPGDFSFTYSTSGTITVSYQERAL